MQATKNFSELPPIAMLAVGIAVIFAMVGSLVGLAGLMMAAIKAFDLMAPGAGDAPILVENLWPYLTIINFVLMVVITGLGVTNLSIALRWQDFLDGEWKRWMLNSLFSVVAALLFVWAPGALEAI